MRNSCIEREVSVHPVGGMQLSEGYIRKNGTKRFVGNLPGLSPSVGDTIEDVLEPYLIQQGYMLRTPRGRMATRSAYLHFGLPAPSGTNASAPDSANLPLDLGESDDFL